MEAALGQLGRGAVIVDHVSRVELVGRGKPLPFKQTAEGLQLTLPSDAPALPYAVALKIV